MEGRGLFGRRQGARTILWIAERTGGPVPRFEKVEREEPADGVVIEGDDIRPQGD
jgi:hypothetical protein